MKKVLIADDHQVTLKGLQVVMKEFFKDVEIFEALSFKNVLDYKKTQSWDLITLEAVMPAGELVHTLREIRQINKKTPVLVYTSSKKIEHAAQAIAEGANGIVQKHQPIDDLVKAVEKVVSGEIYVHTEIAIEMQSLRKSDDASLVHHKLSARELEIFLLIANGLSIKKIALSLSLSEKTVATHLTRSRQKTGLVTPVQIARYAFRNSLVD